MRFNTVLIDGRHLLFRVAATLKGLTADSTTEGTPTGGIFGFIKALMAIYDDHAAPGAMVIICWEGGANVRQALYSEYKMGERAKLRDRDEVEPIMVTINDQMRILQGLLRSTGIRQAYSPEWEADDTMGRLAVMSAKTGTVCIYSGDYDMHQLVGGNIYAVSADRNPHRRGPDIVWNAARVEERWGVEPRRVIDFKALAGDKGDNYDGCPGIGDVWAKKLLTAYATLDDIFDAASAGEVSGEWLGTPWRSKPVAQKLLNGWENVLLSQKLATINVEAPLRFIKGEYNEAKLKELFAGLGFATLNRPTVFAQLQRIVGLI